MSPNTFIIKDMSNNIFIIKDMSDNIFERLRNRSGSTNMPDYIMTSNST
jgi:hypothetical protein